MNTQTQKISTFSLSHLLTFSLLTFSLLTSCTSEQQKLETAIAAKEKELYGDSTMTVDFSKAKDMIALYADFVKKYPEDKKAEDYLFKAGEVSMGVMQSNVAIKYFEQYYEKYPKSDKAPYSLFMQGFIYETQVKNIEKAKWCYEKFIHDFPTHKLASDATYSIANLGKSEEDLIREFEAKIKGDSLSAAK